MKAKDIPGWLKGLGIGIIGVELKNAIPRTIAWLLKEAVDKGKKKVEFDPRADLFLVLASLDAAERGVMWNRHLKAILTSATGDNHFVQVLGKVLDPLRDENGKIDMKRAREIFTLIAQMNDAQYCQVMEILEHDPIAQYIKYWVKKGKTISESLLIAASREAGVLKRNIYALDRAAETKAQEINSTRFGRLANRLFR